MINNHKLINAGDPFHFWVAGILLGIEQKEFILGLQRLQNRSLLIVNEDFEDKRNNNRAFLSTPFVL